MCEVDWGLAANVVTAIATVGALIMAGVAAHWARDLSKAANRTSLDALAVNVLSEAARNVNTAMRAATSRNSYAESHLAREELSAMVSGVIQARESLDVISHDRRAIHAEVFRTMLSTDVIAELKAEVLLSLHDKAPNAQSAQLRQRQYSDARAFLGLPDESSDA